VENIRKTKESLNVLVYEIRRLLHVILFVLITDVIISPFSPQNLGKDGTECKKYTLVLIIKQLVRAEISE